MNFFSQLHRTHKQIIIFSVFVTALSIFGYSNSAYADYYVWTAVTSGPSSGWAAVDSSADGTYIHAVTSDLSILIHQFVNGTYSANLGDSDLNSWVDVATSDSGLRAIATNGSASVIITTDYGSTWGEFQPNGINAAWGKVAISGNGEVMYAYNSYTGTIWKTTDTGQNWSGKGFYNSGAYYGALTSIDISNDGQCVVMGAANGSSILVATDGGDSGLATEYTTITGSPIIDVAVTDDCTKIAIVSGGSIFRSSDGGATFNAIGPSGDWQSIDMSSDGTVIAAAAQSGGVYVTYNGGVNWQLESGAPSGLLRDIKLNSTGNRITLASSNSYIYQALDSGDPVISSITTTATDGAYGAGSIFDVTLHFSKPVSVDGSMIVNFDTGGSCTIDAFGPPGALTASCSYTAGVGENSSDLSVTSITSTPAVLTHAFGTIIDFTLGVLSEIADTRSIVIDTAAPAANTAPFLAASSDTGQSMSDNITNANPPVIGLACETDSVVKIYDTGRNLLGSANCAYQEIEGVSGDYAFVTLSPAFGDGSQTVFGTQTDLALNVSDDSPSFNFTIDTTPPVTSGAPVMTSGTGIITNDTTPTFTGTCTDGNTVAIFDDGVLSAGGYTCSSSAFSITSDTLASGSNSITFKETDVAGNVSSASTPLVVTIDTTLPTISSVSSDKINASYTTGEVIDIDVTFSEAVTTTGNATVTLETGTTDRTCTFTVSNSTTGTCNYTVQAGDTTSDLTVSSISGTVADQAGNAMTNFAPVTNLAANKALVIDTTAPGTPASAPDLTSGSDTGDSSTDNVTNDTTPTFTGTCTDVQINLYVGGVFNTYVACNSGNFSLPSTSLTNGTYDITYTEIDALSNESGASPALTITIDSTSPTLSEVTPISTGTDTTPSYTFTTNEAGTITYGGSCSSLTTSATSGSNTITLVALAVGTYSDCTITVTDTSSNASSPLSLTSFTISAEVTEETRTVSGSASTQTKTLKSTKNTPYPSVCEGGATHNIYTGFPCKNSAPITPGCFQGFGLSILTGEACSKNVSPQTPALPNTPPTPITPQFTKNLELGDIHPEVKLLQIFLNANGFIVSTVGNGRPGFEINRFGPGTVSALIRFQKANGITPAVGFFGPRTRGLVNSF